MTNKKTWIFQFKSTQSTSW